MKPRADYIQPRPRQGTTWRALRKLLDPARSAGAKLLERHPELESRLRQGVAGSDYGRLVSKLLPQAYNYGRPSLRTSRFHGADLLLDISDAHDWYVWWGFRERGLDWLLDEGRDGLPYLDVGANIGAFSLALARKKSATVYAFEPNRRSFRRLITNLRLNPDSQVIPIAKAVTNRSGDVVHIVDPEPHTSGMAHIHTVGTPVGTIAIDDFVESSGLQDVAGIKVDVEGAEALVISGAEATLQRFRPVLLVEAVEECLRRFGTSPSELVATLLRHDYDVYPVGSSTALHPEQDLRGINTDLACVPRT